ncbi:hypothetical protein [Caballeronia sp. dw_19]|uniref:hypothetical protein n=1 Tax=Caballeronia sp. dw_19 TaxID=2719791 RepID=UPI001BD2E86F|nr:hypothetical protein [Caballeronia sp. dw_19]
MAGGGATLGPDGWITNPITPDFNGGGIAGLKSVGVLAQSYAPIRMSGTTVETVLATVIVPGGAMGPNGSVRVTSLWSFNNTANAKSLFIRLAGNQLRTAPGTNFASRSDVFSVQNRGTLASQVSPSSASGPYGTSSGLVTTLSLDTSIDQPITFAGLLTVASEWMTLEGYTVELLNP